jgi:hypothetical protein
MQTFAHFEHVIIFELFGAVFCAAYPRRLFLVCCIVFGTAIALELLQTITPDRHGTVVDALDKIGGGAGGILITKAAFSLWHQMAARKDARA